MSYYERDLAQSIADDRWRIKRARTIESGMFAIGMQHGADSTGSPQVDDALAQSRTWMQEARNLQLLLKFVHHHAVRMRRQQQPHDRQPLLTPQRPEHVRVSRYSLVLLHFNILIIIQI